MNDDNVSIIYTTDNKEFRILLVLPECDSETAYIIANQLYSAGKLPCVLYSVRTFDNFPELNEFLITNKT
jgi:hypothetical protein